MGHIFAYLGINILVVIRGVWQRGGRVVLHRLGYRYKIHG